MKSTTPRVTKMWSYRHFNIPSKFGSFSLFRTILSALTFTDNALCVYPGLSDLSCCLIDVHNIHMTLDNTDETNKNTKNRSQVPSLFETGIVKDTLNLQIVIHNGILYHIKKILL